MAIAGRKPKPAALRLLEGNREHRPIKDTVKFEPGIPTMPGCLFGPGVTEWKRVIKILKTIPGLMTKIDMAALAAYCNNWCIIYQCTNAIRHQGGYKEYLKKCHLPGMNPRYIQELQKAQKEIRAFCNEFGFTPSSRGRIELAERTEDQDPGYLD